jgi:CHAT domain-containing protein
MTFKLATFHQRMGNHEQALAYYQRSRTLSRTAKKVRNEANALSEIAMVYASQGRRHQAANQHRRAQEFYQSIGDRRGQAIALNNYGDFLLRGSQNQEALNTFRDALRLSEEVDDKYIRVTTLYNLAHAHQALGNYEAGLDFIEQAIRLSEELRANVGSLDARASYFSGVKMYYDLSRDILMQLDRAHPGEDYATRAFFISEESRARSLLDSVKESQVQLHEGATVELLRHEREVIGTFRLLAEQNYDLSLSNRRDAAEVAEVANRMDQLRAEYQEIQAELRAQTKQSSVAQLELKDLKHIQKELQAANAILLEYSLGDERSYLWAIASDSVHSYELPARKELEGVVREAYESVTARQNLDAGDGDYPRKIAAADNHYLEKAAQLSQMLVGPVAEQLGTKRLIVVTEGALQYVPFEALPVPGTVPTALETPSFLIQSNEIVVLPSMSTLMIMRASRIHSASPGRIVAVIADPVFSPGDERVQSGELSSSVAQAASSPLPEETPAALLRAGGPGRLAHASEEADVISEAAPWGTTMVAKGFDATRETAMSPRIGEYQIVHFATHGFLDSEHPELSSLVLSKVDQHGVKMSGLLTFPDIYSLDLSAELIVLSACQTALGKEIKGEGLVGLSHSFMSAGAKSVVASLWKVDDRATFVLMSDFYQSMLSRGVPPVAALRAAKLKMLQDKSLSAPYYWAGFVFQGDYEARINVESNSRLSRGLALLLLVLISSGLIVFRRRRRRSFPTERNQPGAPDSKLLDLE